MIDSLWPRGEVRGIVHDPSAMMLGGVAGNAGLFSTAMDMAKLMYLFQERGYSSKTGSFMLKPTTVDLFSKIHAGPTKKDIADWDSTSPMARRATKPMCLRARPPPYSDIVAIPVHGHGLIPPMALRSCSYRIAHTPPNGTRKYHNKDFGENCSKPSMSDWNR